MPVGRPKPTSFQKEKDEGILQAQRLLLTWMIDDPAVFAKVRTLIGPEDFTDGLYREVAKLLYEQQAKGDPAPAKIVSHFQEEEVQKQVAALFHTKLQGDASGDGLSREDREKALSEIIYKVKAHSFEKEKEQMNLADMNAMQQLIQKRRELDRLKKLNISID